MKDISVLNAFTRENTGSNNTKKVRQEKKIPAIIYGDGKNPQPISLNITDLRASFKKSTFIRIKCTSPSKVKSSSAIIRRTYIGDKKP